MKNKGVFKYIKGKKGAGIEIAIAFGVLVFSLIAFTTSLAMYTTSKVNLDSLDARIRIEVDSIGQLYYNYVKNGVEDEFTLDSGKTYSQKYDTYENVQSENVQDGVIKTYYTLTIKVGERVMLVVKIEKENSETKIISWCNNE